MRDRPASLVATVVLGAALAVGCSAGEPGLDAGTSSPQAGSSASQAASPTGTAAPGSSTSSSPGQGDIETYEDYAAMLALMYNLDDPPPVTPVREVRTGELTEAVVACLNDAGFPAEADAGGGWGAEIPSEQQEAYLEAEYVCSAQYPLLPELYRPWDDATIERVHAYLTDDVMPCFAEAGYPYELPTLQTYKARYLQDRSSMPFVTEVPADVLAACGANGFPDWLLLGEDPP
ncbi:hypothetical protein [Salana multivorans]